MVLTKMDGNAEFPIQVQITRARAGFRAYIGKGGNGSSCPNRTFRFLRSEIID